MDFSLRCNSLKCRAQLVDRAVVTTCSHIFCVNCSNAYGLANAVLNNRVCPACEARLGNADDIVVTILNPSEDYKTSVLSGLSPANIMECAGRGLNFYAYQATQEILYQEYLSRSLTEKYDRLSSQLEQVIHDANSEIVSLRNKMNALQTDQESLQRKNNSLREAYNDKVRQYQKSQATYDRLKKKLLESDAQIAAEDTVEQVLGNQTTSRTPRQSILPASNNFVTEQLHRRRRKGGSYGGDDVPRPRQRSYPSPLQGDFTNQPSTRTYHSPQHRTRFPLAQQPTGWAEESNGPKHFQTQAQDGSRLPIHGQNGRRDGSIAPDISDFAGSWQSKHGGTGTV